MDLGLQDDGTMEVPPDGIQAGWYTGAPTPGERGPAVIAGHMDWGGHPAVFNRLHTLGPDDEIIVTREDGTAAAFRVTRLEQYPKNAFASEKVYGDIDHAGLRLITCGGSFDPQLNSYDDNVVVFAELVDGPPSGEAR
jgi:sortase (surface protein transpeptidase)